MNKRLFQLYILISTISQLLSVTTSIGQTKDIDSLRILLTHNLQAKERLAHLSTLAFFYKELDTDSALYFGKLAIDLAVKSKLNKNLPEIYNIIGLAHFYQTDYETAYEDFQQALNIAESLKDEIQIGHSHNNLGRLLLKINDVEQSYDQFLFAKQAFEKANDLSGLSYFYRSISEWYQHSKNYDSAILYTLKATKIRREINNKNSLISALLDLSRLYKLKKEYKKSVDFLEEAEKLSVYQKASLLLADVKLERLELMLIRDSLADADHTLKEALPLAMGNSTRIGKLKLVQARIEKIKGNQANATSLLSQLVTDTLMPNYDLRREATTDLIELLYTNGDFKQAEKLRFQLKHFDSNEKKTKLQGFIERINFRYSQDKKNKIEHELELADHKRKLIVAILLSIVGSTSSVVIIMLVYQKRRNTEQRQHLLKEQDLTRKFEDSEIVNKKLVEESLLLICTHGLSGKILTINTPGAKTIGYEPNRLIGKDLKTLIGSKQSIFFDKYITEITSTGASSGFLNILTEWKEIKIFLYRNILVSDGKRAPYVMCSAIDVTEWKNTEREQKRLRNKLAESERLYRLLSENSSDLVCLHASDGTFQFVSTSVYNLLGYTPTELIGTRLHTLVNNEDTPPILPNPALHNNSIFEEKSTYRILKKNGSYQWMETYVKPIFNNGKLINFQTSSRDVTLRKQYEEHLNLAKTKAEEANRYKSDFVSSMSHEIRTPLNAIVGLAGILLKRNPREDQIKIFQMLKNSSDSLLAIVNDVLDFSKVEAGKMEIEETTFNIHNTLQEIVDLFSTKAESKGINLFFKDDNLTPQQIKSDPLKIRQVVSNLISNAIKFTDIGNVTLGCQCINQSTDNVKILVSVKDTGIGIDADKLDLIFDSFSQAGHDTSRIYGGTGLGLAIVRKLLHLLDSEIEVQSEKGKGSHFYFVLIVKQA